MKKLLQLVLLVSLSATFLNSCEKDNKTEEINAKVSACFSYNPSEIVAGEVQFENCSKNATSYLWDFGDSATSNEKEPKHTFGGDFPYFVSLIASNGSDRDTIVLQVTNQILVKKPNIYIYPETSIKLSLDISFPLGGSIVESIPQYNNGWKVDVGSNGLIDNKYGYLFYESIQPNIFQYNKGWCVARNDLKSFFEKNMALYNFSDTEIADFTEYWIPKLIDSEYYMIYPQTNEIIDIVIKLNFSVQPNNVNRLFYGIIGVNRYTKIEEPSVKRFNRNGFFIMEWGVFIK